MCRILLAALLLSVSPLSALAQPSPPADGRHTLLFANGDSFTGTFRNGKPNGPGTFRMASGEVHQGEWRDGCLVSERWRIALFTTLSACPPAKRRKPPLPRPDFR
jgi:hypothetical protein